MWRILHSWDHADVKGLVVVLAFVTVTPGFCRTSSEFFTSLPRWPVRFSTSLGVRPCIVHRSVPGRAGSCVQTISYLRYFAFLVVSRRLHWEPSAVQFQVAEFIELFPGHHSPRCQGQIWPDDLVLAVARPGRGWSHCWLWPAPALFWPVLALAGARLGLGRGQSWLWLLPELALAEPELVLAGVLRGFGVRVYFFLGRGG